MLTAWRPAKKVLAGKGASKGGSWRTPSMRPPASNPWENSLDFPYPIPCLALCLSFLQQPLWLRDPFSVIAEQPASFGMESSAASVFTLHLQSCCINSQSQLLLCGCAPFSAQTLRIAWFPNFVRHRKLNQEERGSQRKWVSRLCVGSSWQRSEQAQWGVVGNCY